MNAEAAPLRPTADRLAVVAAGGNSLIRDRAHVSIPDQSEAAELTAYRAAELIADGWNVVLTHGNGPQVGFILRRSEIGAHEIPPAPMNYATSNTQGSIGYMFQRSLCNAFRKLGIERRPLLARELGADLFLISTAVDRVAIDYNQPSQRWLDRITVSQARSYAAAGHFSAGSMGPKIGAMIDYLEAGGREGLITDPANIVRAVAGEAGTRMVAD